MRHGKDHINFELLEVDANFYLVKVGQHKSVLKAF